MGDDRVSATDAQIAALDTDIATGNIKSGATIFGIGGNGNVVDTSAGTVTDNAQIRSNYVCFSDGTQYTSSISDCSSEGSQSCYAAGTYYAGTSKTASNLTTSQSAGYYPAFNLATVDTDLVASNIMADVGIFGVSGTLLKNLYNGSAGNLVPDYAFYTQAKGGVDDYNNNGTTPANSYTGSWTTCNAGNSYCATSDATNADKKDNSTNLVWSKWLDTGTAHTWFWANNCYEPGTAENPGTCVNSGDNACQCVKKTSSLVGCEALGGGWRLPYQKELMQAYINGSWGNLSSAGYFYWSATTKSYGTHYAWYTSLSNGNTDDYTKTTTIRVRCVR